MPRIAYPPKEKVFVSTTLLEEEEGGDLGQDPYRRATGHARFGVF